MSRRLRLGLSGAVLALFLCACGAPTSGDVQELPSVPYNLMSPTPPATSAPAAQPSARPRLYLVRDDTLVPVRVSTSAAADTAATVTALLQRLTQGPQEAERNRGLSSALGPDVAVGLVRMDGTTAVVDVRAGAQPPRAGRLPLAVGQIVLTAVSVPGVEAVQLTADGHPVQAPLPDGALTERPLVGRDYISLLGRSTTLSPTPSRAG